jgi:hypothetical protein
VAEEALAAEVPSRLEAVDKQDGRYMLHSHAGFVFVARVWNEQHSIRWQVRTGLAED